MKDPKGFGRVRMRHVPDASGASLVPFVCDVVAPGAVVRTDGWKGYNNLPKRGYRRQKTVRRPCSHHPAIPPTSPFQAFIVSPAC